MSYTNGLDNPELFFQIVLYTGNGSNRTISYPNADADLDADMIWIKQRSDATSHTIFDTVRGAQKAIFPNNTNAETTRTDAISAFGTDGFDLGANGDLNANTETHVAWCWKAGGSSSSNSDGDITTTISANTTSGISICKYSGNGSNDQELGHGMNKIPDMWLIKRTDSASTPNWVVGAKPLGFDDNYMHLNTTDAAASSINSGTGTPTTSVFFVGDHASVNASGATYISYVFSSVQGFSKIGGSYVGNGSSDGTFVYTGFRPAMVIQKVSSTTGSWHIHDSKRSINGTDKYLYPDTSEAEVSTTRMDFLSNGFKLRSDSSTWNGSGATFMYMAFAEAPFVNSKGVPANAR